MPPFSPPLPGSQARLKQYRDHAQSLQLRVGELEKASAEALAEAREIRSERDDVQVCVSAWARAHTYVFAG